MVFIIEVLGLKCAHISSKCKYNILGLLSCFSAIPETEPETFIAIFEVFILFCNGSNTDENERLTRINLLKKKSSKLIFIWDSSDSIMLSSGRIHAICFVFRAKVVIAAN